MPEQHLLDRGGCDGAEGWRVEPAPQREQDRMKRVTAPSWRQSQPGPETPQPEAVPPALRHCLRTRSVLQKGDRGVGKGDISLLIS